MAVQPDGKIVAAGGSRCWGLCHFRWSGFALAGYFPNGRLDPGFGRGGRMLTEGQKLIGITGITALARQSNGKLVAAGEWGRAFTLARYTPRGRLDRRFGKNGVEAPDLGSKCELEPVSAALQADGKIIVSGSSDCEVYSRAVIARYYSNGRLDPSFGGDGSVVTDFGDYLYGGASVIQPDGRIVVAGDIDSAAVLARYLPNGQLDASFGRAGKVIDQDAQGGADALALQADGKIVIGGGCCVERYTANGTRDPSFGDGGRVDARLGVSALAIDGQGRIVVAGVISDHAADAFGLRRYLTDGSPDAAFGGGGVVRTRFGKGSWAEARAVGLQPDGKVILTGSSSPRKSEIDDFALARYLPDGQIDRAFGTGGKVLTNFNDDVTGYTSFSARRIGGDVLLRWRTGWEEGIRGFRVCREAPSGGIVRCITRKPIRARGSATRGASYAVRETNAPLGKHRYVLQEFRPDGTRVNRARRWVRR
jgi:uncharacterized delta-60 repeat protein